MDKKITVNEEELLEQRKKEISEKGNYLKFECVFPNIPNEVLEEIGEKVEDSKGIKLGNFIEEAMDYTNSHVEYRPLYTLTGKDVSVIDRVIAISFLKSIASDLEYTTAKEIEHIEEEE